MSAQSTSGRFEFCSDAWLRQAQRVLSALVEQAGPALAGVRFSGCEVFMDPPANLRQNGEARTYWYFRIGDGAAVATREDRTDVDFRVVVDYQATLIKARTVYPAAPAAAGRSPRQAALTALFHELHNRLAELTA